MITKQGINASPGVAIGPALVLDTEEYRIPRRKIPAGKVAEEIRLLDDALEASRQEVAELQMAVARKLGEKTAKIFAFHEEFIGDARLRNAVIELIESHQYTAAYAFGQEMSRQQRVFAGVRDKYFQERVRDLYDMEKRVLRHVLGKAREDITKLTEPVIVVAHDISPSQAIALDRKHILGFAIDVGGPTSHTAIIARMLGIPAVLALKDVTRHVGGGEKLILDGTHGLVVADPDPETLKRYRTRQKEYAKFEEQLSGLRDLPAVTTDGTDVQLLVNVELADEVGVALASGAEGVGLYRSEFLFLGSDHLPTEDEQFEAYQRAVRGAAGKPLTIRTIDVGADKLAKYMDADIDHNPVIGLRAIRYCLTHLDVFKTHLRAILRAAAEGNVRIMFPMVTTLMELRQAKSTLHDVMEDLEEDGIPFGRDVEIGIMVETPAAALRAAAFCKEVAFVSIGTNDLTQYTLAVDRSNERVAHLFAPHNPAVLQLIRATVQAARKHKVDASMCGEMAGSTIYCELLLGLGLRSLSMAPKDVPEIKQMVRSTSISRCEAIARKVLKFDEDRQVFNYLRDQTRKIIPEAL